MLNLSFEKVVYTIFHINDEDFWPRCRGLHVQVVSVDAVQNLRASRANLNEVYTIFNASDQDICPKCKGLAVQVTSVDSV